MSAKPLLRVHQVSRSFGGLLAVASVSFEVSAGEIVGVVGPNGAGKTTLFNLISGNLRADSGQMMLNGTSLDGLLSHEVAELGVARTFQSLQVFGNMSALENVEIGRHMHSKAGMIAAALRLPFARREERQVILDATRYLERMGLTERSEQLASNLSFGEQRRLEIARALAAEPQVLLLDEPGAGLTQEEKARLGELIREIQQEGVTILLVEHDVEMVMDLAGRVLVLDYGQLIAEGSPEAVQSDPRVIEAYLGAGWGQDSAPVAPSPGPAG